MAGTTKRLGGVTLVDVTTTVQLPGSGAHKSAQFYVNITAITISAGAVNVILNWGNSPTNVVEVARVDTLQATGLSRLTPTANVFTLTRQAIPEPTQMVFELSGDATQVSANVIAVYGD